MRVRFIVYLTESLKIETQPQITAEVELCEVNSDVYHGNNVVYLSTNATIIVSRALENRPLKHALPHSVGSGNVGKVNYGKFRNLLDGVKVIIVGSDD